MSYKHIIFSFLLAVALNPSLGIAQSSDSVVNNTTIRGLQNFQGFSSRGSSSSAQRFGRYASGINFFAPPRTSSNPLAGRNGIQTSRPSPARDFRMPSGLINSRATSARRSGLVNRTSTRNVNRLAINRPITPIRQVRANLSPLAGVSGRTFSTGRLSSKTQRRTGNSPLTKLYGVHSRNSLSGLAGVGQHQGLANRNSQASSTLSLSQRGFRTTSQTGRNRGIGR